ncbi:hypothetical protein CANARDRAFT_197390 [[Candida] arabinofermentans NRRL YB-2248]|uniref:Phospholipase A-2-activating protein n=1 Tax=[Candida] arabinofermentans NRRL YB-2248 TaxID=983967 RepID=A0A1E4T1U4_9ASCO|nr:hypothetical protein CANARDRAFT_197390 [[Candida] arabinofermentans NRRL YB-2248]
MSSYYRLSATLKGHEDDVKTLISPNSDLIISGSRDTTVRSWFRKDYSNKDWQDSIINYKSSKFINSLSFYNDDSNQFIISSGNDCLINLIDLNSNININNNEPEYCLIGHESNVCCLDSFQDLIMSSSWDSTCKIWNKNGDILYNLKGHTNSVWSCKFLSKFDYLTCGADMTVRKWHKDKQVSEFIAHNDVIRDLLIISNDLFATCSNDGLIKIWSLNDFKLLKTLKGHESFVYSLSLTPTGELISSGEDRSIRIWSIETGNCLQIITLPCISIWKVISLQNGDLVTGSSDFKIRIFTKSKERIASNDELLEFKNELQTSSLNENVYYGGEINKDKIPNHKALDINGKIEGQTQMIKTDIGTIEIYQWEEKKWFKIGEIVSSSSTNQKKEYLGKSYDYVFDVDVEDGKPPLKLPFNVSESPYAAADRFLVDNDLPTSYLQQIVEFILSNTTGVDLGSAAGAGAGATSSTSNEPYQDPSYSNKPKSILPQREYLTFLKMDEYKLIQGLKKLNLKQLNENKIDESEFETTVNCQDYKKLTSFANDIILNWDDDSKLLGFDILRSTVLKIQPFENLFDMVKIGLTSNSSKVVMMTMRLLTNIFSAKPWGEMIFQDSEIINIIFFKQVLNSIIKEKLMSITLSTLLLNYSVLIVKYNMKLIYTNLIPVFNEFSICLLNDEESAYRVLFAYGTLYTFNNGFKMDTKVLNEIKLKYGDVSRFEVILNEVKLL